MNPIHSLKKSGWLDATFGVGRRMQWRSEEVYTRDVNIACVCLASLNEETYFT